MSVIKRATELEKWRADYVLKALWRVAHDRQVWHTMKTKPLHLVGGNGGMPAVQSSSPAFLLIRVGELPEMGFEQHKLRLYRREYQAVLDVLSGFERHELKYHLAKPRYSSVFRFHRRACNIQLNDTVEVALGEAAVKIGLVCQEVP
jgi:hypothetical protein